MVKMDKFKMNLNVYDGEAIYCRKLGHHLQFNYCRRESGELPCSRITKCWSGKLPINEFLKTHYSADKLEKAFAHPSPKLTSLIELIQKAQALNGSN
jgi:hypothetical protein